MDRVKAMKPEDVTTPPPWEREEMHYSEVPAVIKRWYGITYNPQTVYDWIRKGKKLGNGSRAYLASHRIQKRRFVRLVDLKAFLKAT